MTLWPGDKVTGENGEEFELGAMLAYQGCESPGPMCSQINGCCVQWHCGTCDAAVSWQGHKCPKRGEAA